MTDGTFIPTQRRTGAANRPNYSGKHHRHCLHVLALTIERSRMICISVTAPPLTSYFKMVHAHRSANTS
ncbi:hypothetical protein ACFC01_20915 [Streptomyces mirabilis]|uniref:hypothetical protein n=1 Tax=Streptomyces mirabilis TaxID=68239 RepID=UPI0035DAC86B